MEPKGVFGGRVTFRRLSLCVCRKRLAGVMGIGVIDTASFVEVMLKTAEMCERAVDRSARMLVGSFQIIRVEVGSGFMVERRVRVE